MVQMRHGSEYTPAKTGEHLSNIQKVFFKTSHIKINVKMVELFAFVTEEINLLVDTR